MKKEEKTKNSDTRAQRLAKNIRLGKERSETNELGIDHTKNIISKVIFGIIVALIAFFFVKTAVWEYYYYQEKEGSSRAPVESVDPDAVTESIEVDETEVTEEQRAAHTVAPDEPRYLTIEKLGIYNARIISVGLTTDGALDTPYNIFDAGWYSRSSKPGSGGVLVMDGHNGGPGVDGIFKKLNQLYSDDLIIIERGDGAKFTYKVIENKEIPLADANQYMSVAFSSPLPGTESLTIISCIGGWNYNKQTYDHRQFTRAILVE
ncbi:class F sortase [Candidatus Saccharibacteria bacterium]|nr:class F sortase [Candidatus Saccharibacteria bacterium]